MRRLDILPGLDWLRRGPIALAAFAALASPVHASPVQASDYYAGKTITFIVGTDMGGGFSIYARAIAKYLARHIPGNPMIVIQNMPGAGGAVASTWLYRIAPKDGTAIGSVSPNAILGRLLDDGRGSTSPTKFNYLAGAERSTRAVHDLPAFAGSHIARRAFAAARSSARLRSAARRANTPLSSSIRPAPASRSSAATRDRRTCSSRWSAARSTAYAGSTGPRSRRSSRTGCGRRSSISSCRARSEPHPELARSVCRRHGRYIKDDIDRKAVELMVEFQQAFGRTYMAPPGVPAEQLHDSALRFHGCAARSGFSGRRREFTDRCDAAGWRAIFSGSSRRSTLRHARLLNGLNKLSNRKILL